MFNPKKLRKAREEKGLSRQALARALFDEKVTISPQTVYNWERGDTRPDVDQLCALSEALNKSIGYFFNLNNNQAAKCYKG